MDEYIDSLNAFSVRLLPYLPTTVIKSAAALTVVFTLANLLERVPPEDEVFPLGRGLCEPYNHPRVFNPRGFM
jgi:hypothetical protein